MNDKIDKTALNKFERIIEENFQYLDNITEFKKHDSDKKHSLAISMTILEEYYKLNSERAKDCLTDGGNDYNIDAFYFDDSSVYEKDSVSYIDLICIQSKFKNESGGTKTFENHDIIESLKNIEKILNGDKTLNLNDKLKKQINYLDDLQKTNGNKLCMICNFIFATNGIISNTHKELQEIKDKEKQNIHSLFYDATSFGDNTDTILQSTLLQLTSDNKKDEVFDEKNSLFGFTARCTLKQIIDFYRTYGEKKLLNNNVRYLNKKSPINGEIQETILKNKSMFWFLNNGISIVSKEYYDIHYTGSGNIKNLRMSYPSIVNGGQTIASINELIEKKQINIEELDKSSVLVKICKTSNPDLLSDIAKSTNSQNPIDVVDLQSNNEYQKIAKMAFSKKGICLIVKTGEDTRDYDDTIDNEYLIQLYSALYFENPAKSKLSKKWVFNKYFNEIFSEKAIEENKLKLFRCYELSVFLKEKKDKCEYFEHAFYAILYGMQLIDKNIIKPEIPIKEQKQIFDTAFDKSLDIINKIVSSKQGELKIKFTYNNLFKGNEIKDLIDIAVLDKSNNFVKKQND